MKRLPNTFTNPTSNKNSNSTNTVFALIKFVIHVKCDIDFSVGLDDMEGKTELFVVSVTLNVEEYVDVLGANFFRFWVRSVY